MFMNQAFLKILAAGLAGSLAVAPAGAEDLRFVTEESFPFQYLEGKQLKGMAVEVVSEIAKRAGIKAEHEILSWGDAYKRATIDRSTCVYSTSRLENRERIFKWVGPIVENKWAVFGKKGMKERPAKLADLRYLRVGVLDGDAKVSYLNNEGIAFALNKVSDDALNPPKLTIDKNDLGKIDVWVTGYYAAKRIAAKSNVTDIEHLFTFNALPNYLACNAGVSNDQIQAMNRALEAMKKDGSWMLMVERHSPK